MNRYVEVSKVEEMLRLIRVSLIVGAGYDIREWLDYVEQMPYVDLVRCSDCKYWEGEKRGQFWFYEQCSLNQDIASCDDFCSRGERKERDGNG